MKEKLGIKHFLKDTDLSKDEILTLFKITEEVKKNRINNRFNKCLQDKSLALMFSKSSTRTRVSFEVGVQELGGRCLYLTTDKLQVGKGESLKDTASTLNRYLDGLIIRTYNQVELIEMSKWFDGIMINALTNEYHPCQSLTDYYTMYENNKDFNKSKIVFIGDGNNVATSLLLVGSILGANFNIVTPKGYEVDREIMAEAKELAKVSGATITEVNRPEEVIEGADVIYTDVWVSMGFEEEKAKRMKAFEGYQVNKQMIAKAKDDFIFLHCLPAARNIEVSDEVIDSDNSKVFDQAENRLHVQKALMYMLSE